MIRSVYLIGSLRNPEVPKVARELRGLLPGVEVFDDWHAAGPHADDHWRDYHKARGHTFTEALQHRAALNTFRYDKANLDRCDAAVLVLPAGKSAHLELGYMAGRSKPTFILMPEADERWDVMYLFAAGVVGSVEELIVRLSPPIL